MAREVKSSRRRAGRRRAARPSPPSDSAGAAIERLAAIMARLRAPGGCPWDREQTHQSLKKYALEETYELHDAIDERDDAAIREELGDLLLQVVFHAQVARERKAFDLARVIDGISEKLVERHPHVFADVKVKDAGEVIANWEEIKRRSKEKAGRASRKKSGLFSGIPRDLPALLMLFRIVEKSGGAGETLSAVRARLGRGRRDTARILEDAALLLSLEGRDPEELLRRANRKRMTRLERRRRKEDRDDG